MNEWLSIHRAHTTNRTQAILDEGLYSDVEVHVEGVVFRCHRYVLAQNSQFFYSEFKKQTDFSPSLAKPCDKIETVKPCDQKHFSEGEKLSKGFYVTAPPAESYTAKSYAFQQEKLLELLGTPAVSGIKKTPGGDFVDIDISDKNPSVTNAEVLENNSSNPFESHEYPSFPRRDTTASSENNSLNPFETHDHPSVPRQDTTTSVSNDTEYSSAVRTINLDFLSADIFRAILKAVYFGLDPVTGTNAVDLYKAALHLQISSLLQYCELFITNLLRQRLIDAAKILYDTEMAENSVITHVALEALLSDFGPDSSKAEWFLKLSPDQLLSVLDDHRLNVRHEDEIYRALMDWYQHDPFSREQYMGHSLAKIRLANLRRRTLVEEVLPHPRCSGQAGTEHGLRRRQGSGDRNDVNLQKLVHRALAYQLLPDRRHDEELAIAEFRPSQASEHVVLVLGDKSDKLYSFSFARKAWFKLAPPPVPFGLGAAACTHGDDLYVSGGDKAMKSFYRYRAETNSWKQLKDMTVGRRSHCAVAVDDCIYVLGGKDDKYSFKKDTLSSVEVFSLLDKNQGWSEITRASLPVPVRSMVAVVVGEKVYIIGGRTNGMHQTVDTIQCFDTRTLLSSLVGHLPAPSCLAQSFVANKVIYMVETDGNILRFHPQSLGTGDGKEVKVYQRSNSAQYNPQDIRHESVERRLKEMHTEMQSYSGIKEKAVTQVGNVVNLNWMWFGLARNHDGKLYVIGGELPKDSRPPSLYVVCEDDGVVKEVQFVCPENMELCYVSSSVCIPKVFLVEKVV